jgi:hypothetical protein
MRESLSMIVGVGLVILAGAQVRGCAEERVKQHREAVISRGSLETAHGAPAHPRITPESDISFYERRVAEDSQSAIDQ